MTTTKKKKVSKKNKSSWRKHTDIKDVEEFLDAQREEERIGSSYLPDKSNKDLFIVDNEGPNNEPTASKLSSKQKRKLSAMKEPRSLMNLKNTSKVPCPIVINKKRNLKDGTEKVLKRMEKNLKAGKKVKPVKRLNSDKGQTKNFAKDIWNQDWILKPEIKKYENNEWISRNLALHHLQGTGKPLIKVHESAHHKTSRLKALVIPHPGTSYNPSYKDHKDLIENIVEKESERIKQEEHLKRVTIDMFKKVVIDEYNAFGDLVEDNANDTTAKVKQENELSDDDEEKKCKIKKLNEKKSKKARRKQEKVKSLENEKKLKKEQKKQITDLHRLKTIMGEISKEECKAKELVKRKKQRKLEKKFEPKRLSKLKFEEPDTDVIMPEEMSGNLRNLKADKKLIVDRFKDFQKRNILPASVDLGPQKRRKIKRFDRKSHKEPESRQSQKDFIKSKSKL